MKIIDTREPIAIAVVEAIRTGNIPVLKCLLSENPGLATAALGGDGDGGMARSLLHVATDWPGHFPDSGKTVTALVAAGADVNARFIGPHAETPLHWAASSDDVEALDALLDAGADIEAPGAVIAGGSPLADARAFKQWRAAHRLVERDAQTTLTDAATLGLKDRIEDDFAGAMSPTQDHVTRAFWGACHGGQRRCAQYLLERGANMNWIPEWETLRPLDAARRSNATELVDCLRRQGAKSAEEPGSHAAADSCRSGLMR